MESNELFELGFYPESWAWLYWAKQNSFLKEQNHPPIVRHTNVSGCRFPPFIAEGSMSLGYQFACRVLVDSSE